MKTVKYIPIELPDDEVKQKLKVAAYWICDSKEYDEKIIRIEVKAIRVYSEHIEVARKNGEILISNIN